jgi:hypothetical protein
VTSDTESSTAIGDLAGRYTSSDDLVIEGTNKGLAVLAQCLRKGPCKLQLHAPPARPEPYEGFLDSIVVREADSLVTVSREGAALIVSGSPAKLRDVAEAIESLATNSPEQISELHLDYYDGHMFLSSSSISLIVERLQLDDRRSAN